MRVNKMLIPPERCGGMDPVGFAAGALGSYAKGPNAGKATAASSRSGAQTQAPVRMLIHNLQNYIPTVSQSKQRCQGVPTQPGLLCISHYF